MSSAPPPTLAFYRGASAVAASAASTLLALRARQGREDPTRLNERLGLASLSRPEGRVVWMHAASVGEILALLPLAERIGACRPGISLLLTTGTRAAAELLARRLPGNARHQFAPIDAPAAVARFLDHWRPEMAVFVESELWPNLILATKARGAKLVLISGKMSDRSYAGWRLARSAIAHMLGAFDLVLARDVTSAQRLRSLGGRVDGLGDLKFGAAPLPCAPDLAEAVRRGLAGRRVVLGASTHPDEEALLLGAFIEVTLPANPAALLILAPRHPHRGPEIETLAKASRLSVARRSTDGDLAKATIYVADTLGELGLWYRVADLAILGGSFVRGFGGHNPLEPARLGCPFVTGPHIEAWPVFQELSAAGATQVLQNAADLGCLFDALANHREDLTAMAKRAHAFVTARDADTGEAIDRVVALLPA